MSVRRDLRIVARRLTQLYKKEILKKELIDTGNLKKSFDVKISMDRLLNIKIEVSSLHYFQYLNEPYTVSQDVLNSLEYKMIELKIVDIITTKLFAPVPKHFKSTENVVYKYKFLNI